MISIVSPVSSDTFRKRRWCDDGLVGWIYYWTLCSLLLVESEAVLFLRLAYKEEILRMSYCRWSSDDFQCDIYAYEHVGGWYQIHVANNRVVGEIPKLLPYPSGLYKGNKEAWDEWMKRYKEQMSFLENVERKPIGLPFDGESYEEPDLASFKVRLLELRNVGYRFPDYVLEEIDEEVRDGLICN